MNLRTKRCVIGLMTWAAMTGMAVAQSPQADEGVVRFGPARNAVTPTTAMQDTPPAEVPPIGDEGRVQVGSPPGELAPLPMAPQAPSPLPSVTPYPVPPGSALGYTPVDRMFQPRFNVNSFGGGLYGYNAGYATVGAFVPFAIEADEALLFVDARGLMTYDGNGGGNIGAGWRWWQRDIDRIVGLNTYYDNTNGGIGSNFGQMGVGFESLGRYIDYRINGYIPVGQHEHTGASSLNLTPFFSQNNIGFLRTTQTAQAYTGFDIEAGGPLPLIGRYGFNGYIGAYHFMGAGDYGSKASFTGVSGRWMAQINEDVQFGMQMTSDHTFGLNTQFQVMVTLPSGLPSKWMRNLRVQDRLTAQVFRQYRAITHIDPIKSVDAAVNSSTNQAYFVAHVNPNLTVAGNGTAEHPFDSIAQFNNLSNAQKSLYNIIYVSGRTDNTDNGLNTGVTLLNNQQLLGSGIAHTITTTQGTYTMPTDGISATPILSNTGMSGSAVVTLANNDEVSGFTINGTNNLGPNQQSPVFPLNSGIVSQAGGIVGFNIHDNTFLNTAAAVNITNTGTALGLLQNNLVTGAGANSQLGFQVTNTGGDLSLYVYNNTIQNVAGTAAAPATAINIVSDGANSVITADNPTPAVTVPPTVPPVQPTGIDTNTITVTGSGNGIGMSAINGGTFNLVVSNNKVTGDWTTTTANQANTGFGISVLADTGGTVNMQQYINNTTTGVYGNATQFAANNGGNLFFTDGSLTTNTEFTGNTFQNSAGDGLFLGANGGTLLMKDILNYTFSGNGQNGLELNVQNGGTLAIGTGSGNNLITGNTFSSNGANGVLVSGTGTNTSLTAVFGDPTIANVTTNSFSGNGRDNVNVIAAGAGTDVKTVFTGISANGAGINGFEFNSSNGAALFAVMTGNVSANNNAAGSGVLFNATGAGTTAVLYMDETNGVNTFNGNGAAAFGTASNQVSGAGVMFNAQNVAIAGLRFLGTANTNGNPNNTNNDINGDNIGDGNGLFFNVNGATTTALEIAGSAANPTTFNTNQSSGLGIFLNNTALGSITLPVVGPLASQTFGSSGILLDNLTANSNATNDGIALSLHNLIGTPNVTITNNTAVGNVGSGFNIDLLNTGINTLTVSNNKGFISSVQQYSYTLDVTPGPIQIGATNGLLFALTNTSATPGVYITSVDVNLAGTPGYVYDTLNTFTGINIGDFSASPLSFVTAANMNQVGVSALQGDLIQVSNPNPTGRNSPNNALSGGGPFDKVNKQNDVNIAFDPTLPAPSAPFSSGKTFDYELGVAKSISNLQTPGAGTLVGATVTVNFSDNQSLRNVIPQSASLNANHILFISPNGSTAANGVDGLHITQTSSTIANTVIQNNNFSNNSGSGINFAKITDSTNTNVSVIGNTLSKNGQNGLAFTAIDGASTVSNVTVASNTITGNGTSANGGDGIFVNVTGQTDAIFSQINNLVIGGPTLAQQNIISNNRGVVANGVVTNGDGIYISRTSSGEVINAQISNNTIQSNTGSGIYLSAANYSSTDDYKITSNIISLNGTSFGAFNGFTGSANNNGITLNVEADAILKSTIDSNTITANLGNGIQTSELNIPGSDTAEVDGFWTRNTITNNGWNGIDLKATMGNIKTGDNLVIGDPQDHTLGNTITGNQQNGINVEGPGAVVIGNNMISSNGFDVGKFNIVSTATQAGGIKADIYPWDNNFSVNGASTPTPFSSVTVIDNTITQNNGDGVQFSIVQGFDGFAAGLQLLNNQISFNQGRGLNVINRWDNTTDITATGNVINHNQLEGVYLVNTASNSQTIYAASNLALQSDGEYFRRPTLNVQFYNNQVLANGATVAAYGGVAAPATGLWVRVGTSGGEYLGTLDTGGFASSGAALAVGGVTFDPLTNPDGTASGRGGVTMTVDNNIFHGNYSNDIAFESFVSAGPPASGTTWDLAKNPFFDPTGYVSTPLARLDLYFRGNVYDSANVNFVENGVDVQNVANPSYVAFYNNADPVFASRAGNIAAASGPGPFNNTGTRRINATRQAGDYTPFDLPGPVVNPPPAASIPDVSTYFLYPGLGPSTFRVSSDSQLIFNLDNTPYTNVLQDANGVYLPPNFQTGETPYGWGSF